MGWSYHLVLFFTLAFTFAMVPITSGARTDWSSMGVNSTRRGLHECVAFNPIDSCWRCKPDWAQNQKTLAQCAKGFGQGTTGGELGDIYEVIDPSDDNTAEPKEGKLRWGVTRDRPLWIIFKGNMTIKLSQELVISKVKTLDGRGANVEICNGGGLTIHGVTNVIIHGIHIHNIQGTTGGLIRTSELGKPMPRAKSDGDAICIFQSTKVMLLGADDTRAHDDCMHVTVAYNKFTDGCDQRMPRCRFGFFHIVNNDYDRWGTYAIGGSAKPTIISHGNRFLAPDNRFTKNVLVRANATEAEWQTWNWRSQGDLLLNGAIFTSSGVDPLCTAEEQGHMMKAEPADIVEKMCQTAGILSCIPGTPC